MSSVATALGRPLLPPERITKIAGFGLASAADGYLYKPASPGEAAQVFDLARRAGRQVVLRGAGRSYGDAAIAPECLILDSSRMNQVLSWDRASGLIDVQCGVTIEDLWRHTLEDGWWPPVVSGTMYPTIGGALAMNIHGKNAFRVGTLGEHVVEIEALTTKGERLTITPLDERFYALISGAGLLAMITRVKMQMKRVHSGDLRVLPLSLRNWEEQFSAFERFEPDADYMVSWIDCFGWGRSAGRGLFHAAWYTDEPGDRPSTLRPESQDLPDEIMGLYPKSRVWRILRRLNNRTGMRLTNWAKYRSGRALGDGRPHTQSLVGFSFLLDYVPNWRNAYLPGGFIQYQSFVPKEHAQRVFARQIEMQQEARLESFLGVLKRHRPDKFLFSHGVDGYSLALDFKVTERRWPDLQELCWRISDMVLAAGGRFYFAKDSTLRPSDVRAYLGEETIATYERLRSELDPDNLLTSSLAKRVELDPP